jgi:hypothetical protein
VADKEAKKETPADEAREHSKPFLDKAARMTEKRSGSKRNSGGRR